MIKGRGRITRAWHKEMVGRNLTLAREALGSTRNDWIAQYGKSHGVYASKLCMWEGGVSYPDLFFLMGLCEDHGLTLDWLFRGDLRGLPSDLASALAPGAVGIPARLGAKAPL
jgi:hypothetical protein